MFFNSLESALSVLLALSLPLIILAGKETTSVQGADTANDFTCGRPGGNSGSSISVQGRCYEEDLASGKLIEVDTDGKPIAVSQHPEEIVINDNAEDEDVDGDSVGDDVDSDADVEVEANQVPDLQDGEASKSKCDPNDADVDDKDQKHAPSRMKRRYRFARDIQVPDVGEEVQAPRPKKRRSLRKRSHIKRDGNGGDATDTTTNTDIDTDEGDNNAVTSSNSTSSTSSTSGSSSSDSMLALNVTTRFSSTSTKPSPSTTSASTTRDVKFD